tara:strand:+ start:6664 stop:7902 length:1239 start_codon:yes stop_codon:yes gene_type:complete
MSFSSQLGVKQRLILKKYIEFSKKLRKKLIYNSPFLYPCTWYDNFSNSFLKSFYGKKNIIILISKYIKEVLLIISILNYRLYTPNQLDKKYKKFCLTWIKKKDISNGKLINDRYLNVNKKENNLFLCLNLDKDFKNTKKNSLLVFTKSSFINFNTITNFFLLINFIFLELLKGKLIYSLNVYSFFAFLLFEKSKKILKKTNFDEVLMSYEGQPFQNLFIKNFKRQKIKTIGIIKSFQPFPIHLYKNEDSPDKVYFADNLIKNHMLKNLEWKEKDFDKKFKYRLNNLKGKIVLPFSISNYDKIYNLIKNIYYKKLVKNFENLKVKIHPNTPESLQQIELTQKINELFKNKKNKNQPRIVLAIGSTSVIIENIILGNKVIQIYEDEISECISHKYWPDVKVKKLLNNVIIYTKK